MRRWVGVLDSKVMVYVGRSCGEVLSSLAPLSSGIGFWLKLPRMSNSIILHELGRTNGLSLPANFMAISLNRDNSIP